MRNGYEPISLDRREEYQDHLARCPRKVSDYSFGNLWAWAEEYGLRWRFDDLHVWILQTRPVEIFWAPVGPWNDVDWSRCPVLAEGGTFIRVPEPLCRIWRQTIPDRLTLNETRGQWDYVYEVSDLVKLKGTRFHKKKNLLKQFETAHDFRYRPLTPNLVDTVLEMQNRWLSHCDANKSRVLRAENTAVVRMLRNWDRIPGLLGGVIEMNDDVAAYTVAEALTPDMLVIHFEKGRRDLKGAYQAINQRFLANAGTGYLQANREQDMDDEGLRQSKLSYQPSNFLKKWTAVVAAT